MARGVPVSGAPALARPAEPRQAQPLYRECRGLQTGTATEVVRQNFPRMANLPGRSRPGQVSCARRRPGGRHEAVEDPRTAFEQIRERLYASPKISIAPDTLRPAGGEDEP